ncbi:Wzz/FepE/Etk N-terminal domain-containing protein [Thiohalorhabdus sp. Cl-TMA]|uniref:Wzz/FepE/Etk N-terminal domain-containing protein n=1 Tax=Thiohalorhabdus methylotrophus TaxID=3242694 RepID=A0ABV4TZM6_9GAMM
MADQDTAEYRRPPAEDEIDLADLVGVLYRRRWLIVGTTLVVFLAAVAYALTLPAKYNMESFLSIGQMEGEFLEKPEAIPAKIRSLTRVYQVNNKEAFKKQGVGVGEGDISTSVQGGGIIRFAFNEVPKSPLLTELMHSVNSQIVEQHKGQIQGRQARLREEIKGLKEQRAQLQERKQALNARLEQATEEQSGDVTVIRQLLDSVRMNLNDLGGRLSEAQANLAAISPTEVVMEPTYSENPVAPSTRMIAALGLVLGGFMAVFLAFLVEFWVNNRDRIKGTG